MHHRLWPMISSSFKTCSTSCRTAASRWTAIAIHQSSSPAETTSSQLQRQVWRDMDFRESVREYEIPLWTSNRAPLRICCGICTASGSTWQRTTWWTFLTDRRSICWQTCLSFVQQNVMENNVPGVFESNRCTSWKGYLPTSRFWLNIGRISRPWKPHLQSGRSTRNQWSSQTSSNWSIKKEPLINYWLQKLL